MSILDSMLSAGGDGIVKQLASQFGIDSEHATSAVTAIVPALAGAMKERLAGGASSGLTDLIGGGSFSKFADDPTSLATPAAAQQGQNLLSSLLGSNGISTLVSSLAEKTGISASVLSSMLPIVASLFGSMLSKSTTSGGDMAATVGQLADVGHGGILSAVKGLAAKMLG